MITEMDRRQIKLNIFLQFFFTFQRTFYIMKDLYET